jgi:spoIIIJ-associated protein
MPATEITAHDVETAINQGLGQLDLLRAEVKIEVLDEGSRGVLGIGARPARVRLTPYAEIEAGGQPASPLELAEPDEPPLDEPPLGEPPLGETADQAEALDFSQAEALEAEEEPSDEIERPPAGDRPGTDRPLTEDDARLAADLTQGVLDRMDFDATCAGRVAPATEDRDEDHVWVDIEGRDASRLLAHQSEALDALQLVVQMMWAHKTKSNVRITLDADHYKAQRDRRLTQMALRLAERVVDSGRSITLEPMPPAERRLVHLALRDHPAVMTESQGEGSDRRVTIKLKK